MSKAQELAETLLESEPPRDYSIDFHISPEDSNFRDPKKVVHAIIGALTTMPGSHPLAPAEVRMIRFLLSDFSREQLIDLYNRKFGKPYEQIGADFGGFKD
jgi:hypothetical protein